VRETPEGSLRDAGCPIFKTQHVRLYTKNSHLGDHWWCLGMKWNAYQGNRRRQGTDKTSKSSWDRQHRMYFDVQEVPLRSVPLVVSRVVPGRKKLNNKAMQNRRSLEQTIPSTAAVFAACYSSFVLRSSATHYFKLLSSSACLLDVESRASNPYALSWLSVLKQFQHVVFETIYQSC
jgi:hypothetical protein